MIVVVQQTKTRLFLGQAGGWVKDAVEARNFRRAADAVAYCAVECLVNVRVVIISDDPSQIVYFCPESSRQEILWARKLRRKNRELQKKQEMLKAEVQAIGGEIAQEGLTLPMRRKQERENPPPDLDGAITP